LNYLSELENWLSKQFTTLISFIEKNVMLKLKAEFSKLFAEWFTLWFQIHLMFVSATNFTPIVEQQDYEIEYCLSFGRRKELQLLSLIARAKSSYQSFNEQNKNKKFGKFSTSRQMDFQNSNWTKCATFSSS